MTKQCAICGAELKTPLDEFGDQREPCCKSCWLAQNMPDRQENDPQPKGLFSWD